MLGRPFGAMYPQSHAAAGAAALVVEDLCVPGSVERFCISVPKGKIVCIAGQVGSGAVESSTRSPASCIRPAEVSTSRARSSSPGSAVRALRSNVMLSPAIAPRKRFSAGCACTTTWSRRGWPTMSAAAYCAARALRTTAGRPRAEVGVDQGRLCRRRTK